MPETNISDNILSVEELCDLLRIPRNDLIKEKENIIPFNSTNNTILKYLIDRQDVFKKPKEN